MCWSEKEVKVEIKGDNRINAKDIYKEMLDGRKFEFEHLWQRSIFLGAFMLAIAAAYGTIIMSMFFSGETSRVIVYEVTAEQNQGLQILEQKELSSDVKWVFVLNPDAEKSKYVQHGIACAVCWLGIVFSMLWIMMAKGSKNWADRYEKAIIWFENSYKYYDDTLDNEMPYYGNMPELKSSQISQNLFSTLAGKYSMSKINITIGIVALILWGFLNMVHFGMFLKTQNLICLNDLLCALLSIVEFFVVGIVMFSMLNKWCKSVS